MLSFVKAIKLFLCHQTFMLFTLALIMLLVMGFFSSFSPTFPSDEKSKVFKQVERRVFIHILFSVVS